MPMTEWTEIADPTGRRHIGPIAEHRDDEGDAEVGGVAEAGRGDLDDIEHGKVRRFGDPRIHSALVCGSVSCPTLRFEPYEGDRLDASADPDVADKVCLMYTHAAKAYGWFAEVTLVVWGPSQRLLVGDPAIQAKVEAMQADGVVVEACSACARKLELVEELEALGIDVKGMGVPLTGALKDPGTEVLTF